MSNNPLGDLCVTAVMPYLSAGIKIYPALLTFERFVGERIDVRSELRAEVEQFAEIINQLIARDNRVSGRRSLDLTLIGSMRYPAAIYPYIGDPGLPNCMLAVCPPEPERRNESMEALINDNKAEFIVRCEHLVSIEAGPALDPGGIELMLAEPIAAGLVGAKDLVFVQQPIDADLTWDEPLYIEDEVAHLKDLARSRGLVF